MVPYTNSRYVCWEPNPRRSFPSGVKPRGCILVSVSLGVFIPRKLKRMLDRSGNRARCLVYFSSCRSIELHSEKCPNCNKSTAGLLPCNYQADIRMGSHRLLRLDDNKSAASCQQACCKVIQQCSQNIFAYGFSHEGRGDSNKEQNKELLKRSYNICH